MQISPSLYFQFSATYFVGSLIHLSKIGTLYCCIFNTHAKLIYWRNSSKEQGILSALGCDFREINFRSAFFVSQTITYEKSKEGSARSNLQALTRILGNTIKKFFKNKVEIDIRTKNNVWCRQDTFSKGCDYFFGRFALIQQKTLLLSALHRSDHRQFLHHPINKIILRENAPAHIVWSLSFSK